MPEMNANEIQTKRREALDYIKSGDLGSAIQVQEGLIQSLFEHSPKEIQNQPVLADGLDQVSGELINSLRWSRQNQRAIEIQEKLILYFPEREDAYRLGAANLRVESGEVEKGLKELIDLVNSQPDNYWFEISLAGAFLYVEQYEEAEKSLRRAVNMTHVRKVDRAIGLQYLFRLYCLQERIDEALATYREAGRMDHSLRTQMLPDVCRTLIYFKQNDEARKYIAQDKVMVRRMLFTGLLAFMESKPADAAKAWFAGITDFEPGQSELDKDLSASNNAASSHAGAFDAYAEICLRMGNGLAVVNTLQPLVDEGKTSFDRLVLLGLGYILLKDLEKARRPLESALRLGDMERPRRTRHSDRGRIFDHTTALLFSALPIHPNIRKIVSPVFVP